MAETNFYAAVLKKYLASKGITLTCPICQSRSWSVTAPIAANRYEGSTTFIGSSPIIELPAVCNNCGHVVHFAWKLVQQGQRNG
jgi:hypothetical protein